MCSTLKKMLSNIAKKLIIYHMECSFLIALRNLKVLNTTILEWKNSCYH